MAAIPELPGLSIDGKRFKGQNNEQVECIFVYFYRMQRTRFHQKESRVRRMVSDNLCREKGF
jgi:hypothetical protein